MNDQNKIADPIEYVSKNTDIVMCDGGSGDLGHPACLLYTSPSPRDY